MHGHMNEKLLHLVGFIIKEICCDARSHERKISVSSWFYYKEICYDARSHERKMPYNVTKVTYYRAFMSVNIM